ncbi:MAG: hypothetical protein NZM42_13860, partial [Gemmatales bacterium]|nr:hypothetical protein [Gemmatales bacterium]
AEEEPFGKELLHLLAGAAIQRTAQKPQLRNDIRRNTPWSRRVRRRQIEPELHEQKRNSAQEGEELSDASDDGH